MANRYEIISAAGRAGITCMTCGMTSWNPGDVKNRYCGKCHVFHEDAAVGSLIESLMKEGLMKEGLWWEAAELKRRIKAPDDGAMPSSIWEQTKARMDEIVLIGAVALGVRVPVMPVPVEDDGVPEDIYRIVGGGYQCMMCLAYGLEWSALAHDMVCPYASGYEGARTHGEARREFLAIVLSSLPGGGLRH